MPEGVDEKDLKKHSQAVAEMAKIKGYRLLSRLQIQLYGKERRK